MSIREVSLEEAKDQFESLVAEVEAGKTEVILRKEGRAIARLIPSSDIKAAARERFFSRAEELREPFHDLPDQEIEATIDRAVAQVKGKYKAVPSPSGT